MLLIIGIIISFGVSIIGFQPWFPHFRLSVSAKNFHFGASLVTMSEIVEVSEKAEGSFSDTSGPVLTV